MAELTGVSRNYGFRSGRFLPIVFVISSVVGGFFACASLSCTGKAGSTSGNGDAILRMSGSNTIGAKLGPAMASAFLQNRKQATDIKIEEIGRDETRVSGRLPDSNRVSYIEIHAHGSDNAFKDLKAGRCDSDPSLKHPAAGKCDIGMASRKVRPSEASDLASLGDFNSEKVEHVIGLDGVTIIVHLDNPVSILSIDQIAGIFSGDIRSWSDVGGNPGQPRIYARNDSSGTYDTFKNLVLRGRPLVAGADREEDSRVLAAKVASDVNGIGFVGLPYAQAVKKVAVAQPGVKPFLPTRFNIFREYYPLSRRLYLYVPENASVTAKDFADFVTSDEGQRVVEANDFIGLSLDEREGRVAQPEAQSEPEERPPVGADPTPMPVIYFKPGSYALDSRATDDIVRIVNKMSMREFRGKTIAVLGYTDNTGPVDPGKRRLVNRELSCQRAEEIIKQLENQGPGLTLEKRCMGEADPVGDNGSVEGRNKNRRVAVWIMK